MKKLPAELRRRVAIFTTVNAVERAQIDRHAAAEGSVIASRSLSCTKATLWAWSRDFGV